MGFHLELGCLLSDWAQLLNSMCVGGWGIEYKEQESTRQGFGEQRSHAPESGTSKKVFVPRGC